MRRHLIKEGASCLAIGRLFFYRDKPNRTFIIHCSIDTERTVSAIACVDISKQMNGEWPIETAMAKYIYLFFGFGFCRRLKRFFDSR